LGTSTFGDKQQFAVEVGEFWQGYQQLRRVDLWVRGRWLTCDDNTVYVPQFCAAVRRTVNWLMSGCDLTPPFLGVSPLEVHRKLLALEDETREKFWFPHWGPTTDNVLGHLFRVAGKLVFTVEFWRETHPRPEERGIVFAIEISQAEFLGILEQTLIALGCGEEVS
jgi:hypothetical protein